MTDLATALLRDVPRYDAYDVMMTLDGHPLPGGCAFGKWVRYSEVLATLTAAMDPAIAERAGEVLERLQKADEYEPLGHDGWDAADLITALLAQNAALRAERDEARAAWEIEAATMKRFADRHERNLVLGAETRARAEAAEAEVEKLRGALEWYAKDGWNDRSLEPPTPEEVEVFGDNILDFPMPEIFFDRGERARAALSATTEEGHD